MTELIEKFFRQHWKGIVALLLAFLALGLIIAFPSSVVFIGDMVLFGATPFEFLSLMMLSEIPFFMGLSSFFAAAFAFLSILVGSALFNLATYCYNYCFEKVKQFWQKHPTVMIILAALIVVATVALMVVTQSWIIPVAMVLFHVASKVMQWLNSKINPKCDMILLSENEDADPANDATIPSKIRKQMRSEHSYFKYKNDLYEPKNVGNDVWAFKALKPKNLLSPDEKTSFAQFNAEFPQSTEPPHKVVSALERGIKRIQSWKDPNPSLQPVPRKTEERIGDMEEEKRDSEAPAPAPAPATAPDVAIDINPANATFISKEKCDSSTPRTRSPSPSPLRAPTSSLFDANKPPSVDIPVTGQQVDFTGVATPSPFNQQPS